MRRTIGRSGLGATLVLLLASCDLASLLGQPTDAAPWAMPTSGGGFEPLHEVIPRDARDGAELTLTPVNTTLDPTPIEGYVAFARLETADGGLVMDQRIGNSLTHRVPAGAYRLIAYLRTCDASCAYLDPPQDVCAIDLSLAAGESYAVRISMQGKRCSLL